MYRPIAYVYELIGQSDVDVTTSELQQLQHIQLQTAAAPYTLGQPNSDITGTPRQNNIVIHPRICQRRSSRFKSATCLLLRDDNDQLPSKSLIRYYWEHSGAVC